MSLFDKFKNLFYEEEIKEEVKVEPQEEIKEEKKLEEKKEEVKKEEPERKIFNNEPTFKFPIAFDDDFDEKERKSTINMIDKKFKMPEVPKKEKKEFKPSPMISPIYGVMDKGSKQETTVRDGLLENSDKKPDLEEVRSKAYGTVISREEKYSNNDKESIEKTEINLFFKEEPIKEKREVVEEQSYEEEQSYDLNEIDEKIKSIDELLKDTGDEDDLYSLVDKMYKDKEEGDDENDVY